MSTCPTYCAHLFAVGASIILAWPAAVAAQQQIVPSAPVPLSSPVMTINNDPGDQTLPHVNADLTAYTDVADNRIHFYRFSTGVDAPIPAGDSVSDTLSDVSGNRICFTREEPSGDFQVAVFDAGTSLVTEIDPQPGALRLGCAIGGDTLVYVDFGTGSGTGDIFVYDLANPSAPQALSLDLNQEQNPNVSPDGNTVVWENCPAPSNCDVMKATRSGGVWTVSTVVDTLVNEENPDSDGSWIVYDAHVGDVPNAQQIFFSPAAGGPATQLVLGEYALNPSVSRGIIGFERTDPSISFNADVFVYDIATNLLYQITSTPDVHEELNDVSVLDNGDVRVVWAANDGAAGDQNIYATTFTPIRPATYQVCPLYDGTVARKSGSAYPIKVQICDASGDNLSSSSIVLHAVSVTQVSTSVPATLDDTGNANPDLDFRYDSTLAGYAFNLSTKGYATGTYSLNFTAGADPALHSTLFAVK
jgi:hypothetical protein